MTGFKNFLLRGNLIELAVAFIMGVAFNSVVTTFTTWITSVIPGVNNVFDRTTPGGAFGNAVISFVILAAVVYFFIVLPYTRAKERFFPAQPQGTPADIALLTEIRDLLATRNGA